MFIFKATTTLHWLGNNNNNNKNHRHTICVTNMILQFITITVTEWYAIQQKNSIGLCSNQLPEYCNGHVDIIMVFIFF